VLIDAIEKTGDCEVVVDVAFLQRFGGSLDTMKEAKPTLQLIKKKLPASAL